MKTIRTMAKAIIAALGAAGAAILGFILLRLWRDRSPGMPHLRQQAARDEEAAEAFRGEAQEMRERAAALELLPDQEGLKAAARKAREAEHTEGPRGSAPRPKSRWLEGE